MDRREVVAMMGLLSGSLVLGCKGPSEPDEQNDGDTEDLSLGTPEVEGEGTYTPPEEASSDD